MTLILTGVEHTIPQFLTSNKRVMDSLSADAQLEAQVQGRESKCSGQRDARLADDWTSSASAATPCKAMQQEGEKMGDAKVFTAQVA